jgi:hypothetical protein
VTHLPKADTLSGEWKSSCASYTYGYTPDFCKTNGTVDMYFANNLWNYSSDFISRTLYVGENLYTIGDSKIQMQTFANILNPIATKVFEVKKNPTYPIPLVVQ